MSPKDVGGCVEAACKRHTILCKVLENLWVLVSQWVKRSQKSLLMNTRDNVLSEAHAG